MNTPCHSYLAVGLAVLALAACQQAPQVPEASSAAAQPTEQTPEASSAAAEPAQQTAETSSAAAQPTEQTPEASSAAAEPAQQTAETSSAAVPDEPRITTEQEFREKVVGKRLTTKGGYVIVQEDGTLMGAFGKGGKDKLTGLWTWEDHYCRTAKIGTKDFGHDCQTVEVSGDVVTFTRKKGKGKKSVWKIESGS